MEKTLQSYTQILEWYSACGADTLMSDVPRNHYIDNVPGKFSLKALAGTFAEKHSAQLEQMPLQNSPLSIKSIPAAPKINSPTNVAPRILGDIKSPALSDDHGNHPAFICETLEQLRSAMENAKGCDLIKAATHTVFADGDPSARIMIIGEAPGADEDRVGQPFVGQSGQLLNTILATIGLDRKAVYISNIIPWRPPGNRPPTTTETNYCLPFIHKHIELISPKILILLGGVAVKTLLGRSDGILKLRGQIFEYTMRNGTTIAALPTFHPSYIMRSPSQKAQVWKDMLILKKWLSKNLD
ncbi:MAG: uracil-DNA glycosylase [Candidatus Paracaedibacteraceae bacterium]|nr:uracil-DNA glycosylase [Candidatus Paracaedibacteraceae bacterium]